MRPTRSLEVCRLDACLSFDSLEERVTPAADPWMNVVSSEVVATDGATGPYADATPINAAQLSQVRTAFPNTTGAGYSVAVLDTGVDYRHPALGGGFGAGYKVVAGYNFVDNTVAGYVSGIPRGGNPMDENGHGTNVAGIIAAKDPIYGGVAPDAQICALRVLDKNGHGAWGWIDEALQWVITNRTKYNITAVNMSLGGGNYTGLTSDFDTIQSKLQYLWNAGVVNVASGGNDYYLNGSVAGIQFPAISQWAVAVGAVYDGGYGARTWASGAADYVTYKDKIASFTQRSTNLDMLAPGAIITSTGLSGGAANYISYAGSSQASPFVAAAAVLVKQKLVQAGSGALATAQNIVDILRTTGVSITDNKPASEDNVKHTGLTFPRLNILAALQKAAGSVTPDQYEANETQAAAKFLGYLGTSSAFTGLTFHTTTDTDYYSFIATTPGTYRIQAPVTTSGMSAPSLTFYDVTASAPRTINATIVNGVATIDVTLRDKVRYFLRTKATAGQVGNYKMTLQGGSAAGSSTGPDRFEANETQAAAKFVGYMGNSTVDSLSLHTATDVDWYRFQTTIGGTRQIQIVAPGNPGKVTFTFYDVTASAPRTINATFVNGVATVNVSLRTGVNYFLKATGIGGATVPYQIVFGAGSSSSSAGMPLDSDLVDRALMDLV